MNLTNLTTNDEQETDIDLNIILEIVLNEYKALLTENNVSFTMQTLPLIKGHRKQLLILFRSLLDNAIKFTNREVIPSVRFSYQIGSGNELTDINKSLAQMKFHIIICSDNGIGFDKKFAARIFRIFQRLHSQDSQYDGRGIGLAICQRIMANHKGYILADGIPGNGATFKLFFPV